MNSPISNDGLILTDAEFRMFAELIREHAGLDFAETSRFLLERRLSRRIRELELGSIAAYAGRERPFVDKICSGPDAPTSGLENCGSAGRFPLARVARWRSRSGSIRACSAA